MRTDDFRRSDNVEDDREQPARSRGGMPGGAGGLGIGTIIIHRPDQLVLSASIRAC